MEKEVTLKNIDDRLSNANQIIQEQAGYVLETMKQYWIKYTQDDNVGYINFNNILELVVEVKSDDKYHVVAILSNSIRKPISYAMTKEDAENSIVNMLNGDNVDRYKIVDFKKEYGGQKENGDGLKKAGFGDL